MINLLPPDYRAQQRFGRYNVVVARYVLLIVLVTALLCSILFASSLVARRNIQQLNTTIGQKQQLVKDYETVTTRAQQLNSKLSNIQKLFESQSNFSVFLGELEIAVPKTAKLKGLTVTHSEKSTPNKQDEQTLQLTFDVINQTEIAKLQQALEQMDRVDFVDVQTLNRNTNTDLPEDFTVVVVLSLTQRPGEILAETTAEVQRD